MDTVPVYTNSKLTGSDKLALTIIIIILLIPVIALWKFHVDSVDSKACRQHVLFTPNIYSSSYLINLGFTFCNQDNSFWSLNN